MAVTEAFSLEKYSSMAEQQESVRIRAEGKVKYDQLLPLLSPGICMDVGEQVPSIPGSSASAAGALPSRRRGQFEFEYVASFPTDQYMKAHQLLDSICRVVGFPHQTFASACHFFHRYMYIYHLQPHMASIVTPSGKDLQASSSSLADSAISYVDVLVTNRLSQHFINDIAVSCLFSASKLEETVRKSRELLPLVLPMLPKYSTSGPGGSPVVFNDVDDPILLDYRNKMLLFERDILLASSFRFDFVHPHSLLLKICKRISVPRLLAYKCWMLLKKSYIWPHCVCFSHADLACACLFLSCYLNKSILEISKNGQIQTIGDLLTLRFNGAHWTRYFGADIERVIALSRNIALMLSEMEPENIVVQDVLITLNSLVSKRIEKRIGDAKAAKEREEKEAHRKSTSSSTSGQRSRKTSDAWDRRVKRFESMGASKSQIKEESRHMQQEPRREERQPYQRHDTKYRERSREQPDQFHERRDQDRRPFQRDNNRSFRDERGPKDQNDLRYVIQRRESGDDRDQRFRGQGPERRQSEEQRFRNEDRGRQNRPPPTTRSRSREDQQRRRHDSREEIRWQDRDRRRSRSRSRSRSRERFRDDRDRDFQDQHRKRNYEDFKRNDQPRHEGNRREGRDQQRDRAPGYRRRSRSRSPKRYQ